MQVMEQSPLGIALLRLADEHFDWYRFDEAMPCNRDQETASAVRAFMAATPEERNAAAASVDVYSGHTLASFGERCASWALTSRQPDLIVLGMAAVGWQWLGCEDPCDGIAVLGALYDAATRLGLSAEQAFAAARQVAPSSIEHAFADFLTRDDLGQIAKVMGYAVRQDGDTWRYLRSW